MKKFLLLIAAAMLSLTVVAQNVTQVATQGQPKPKSNISYQGEVSAGYNYNLHIYKFHFADFQTVHGIRVADYLSTGVGLGVDLNPGVADLRIFINVRGYLPVSKVTRLFVGVDGGMAIMLAHMTPGPTLPNVYLSPNVGASFKVSKKSAVNVSLNYKTQFNEYSTNSLGVSVGFQF